MRHRLTCQARIVAALASHLLDRLVRRMTISFVFESSDANSKRAMAQQAKLQEKENAKMSRLQQQVTDTSD